MSEKSQLDKFKAKARELECDEDEERFNANLRKLAKRPARESPAPK
jgi:hypothetical protein